MPLPPLAAELLDRPLRPGADLAIEAEIGRGGMGCVWRATDVSLDRVVAMKVIRDPGPGRPGRRQRLRFLREARLTASLQHPGIVPVYDLGRTGDGQVFYTMPLVRGSSLDEVFRRHAEGDEAWPQSRVLALVARMAETVAYAHGQGVIHRDLKPANVMVGDCQEVYVLDWGLARRCAPAAPAAPVAAETPPTAETPSTAQAEAEFHTVEGSVLGTLEFMAPEQLGRIDAAVGPGADIYALGAILYGLLAGAWPYRTGELRRRSTAEVWTAARAAPPAPIEDIAAQQPKQLLAICRQAMREDPAERYGDTRELAGDLRAFLEQRVVRAYRTGAVAELHQWLLRNKTIAAMVVGIFAVVLGALLLGAGVANAAAERAAEQRDVAVLARQRVLRLADIRRLARLEATAQSTWPAHSGSLDNLDTLLRRAQALRTRRALHTEALATLRRQALPQSESAVAAEAAGLRARLANTAAEIAKSAAMQSQIEELLGDPAGQPAQMDRLRELSAMYRKQTLDLQKQQEVQAAQLGRRQHWSFAGATEAWQHDVLLELLAGLDRLPAILDSLRARRQAASVIGERSLTGARAKTRWARALADIGSLPAYHGLALEPQEGLLPLARNPATGLWEFVHLQSGQGPDGQGGVVLALLPPGTFRIGSYPVGAEHPAGAPLADRHHTSLEGPVAQVRLDAFFLGVRELTQAQWQRAGLPNPSTFVHDADAQQLPVHHMNLEEAERYCQRMGFLLPTEAQWEYACRAGTTTVYWCGDDKQRLRDHENIGSRELSDLFPADTLEGWSDGARGLVRGGRYRPNPFGLYDLHGNVREWCRNRIFRYGPQAFRLSDGMPLGSLAAEYAVRGSDWRSLATAGRSASRTGLDQDFRGDDLGLRVVWEIRR